MGALLSTGETGRWVWGVGGVSSLVGVLWRGVGRPQMGSDGDEEQIVQSGTWDGDSTIPALASPADSPCWRQRGALCCRSHGCRSGK